MARRRPPTISSTLRRAGRYYVRGQILARWQTALVWAFVSGMVVGVLLCRLAMTR